MADRTTKLLLAVVALGIWVNAALLFAPPGTAVADEGWLRQIDTSLSRIADGTCKNDKIC